MATTALREDYLGRNLTAPTSASTDNMGRVTTSTVDYLGRPLRRTVRANSTAYALNTELAFSGGNKYAVTTAGTTAASPPTEPAVGDPVTDGTAVLTRTK
jgi:hypothetical protein